MRLIIPARKGSKGLPLKNRKLMEWTIQSIPKAYRRDTIVTTDDSWYIDLLKPLNIRYCERPEEFSNDTASMKSTIKHVIEKYEIDPNEMLVILYLTYPERTWKDVENAMEFFTSHPSNPSSMLCKKEVKTNPFLCLKEEAGDRGSQLFYHNLYRRQDYPKCFEISHYVSIVLPSEIDKLNDNLYNADTVYFQIPEVIDVDTEKDLKKFRPK